MSLFFLYIEFRTNFRNTKIIKEKSEPMFTGQYQFVKMSRNEGISKTSQKPFDIAKIILSDGLESVEHDIQPNLVPSLEPHLKKGDKVEVDLEATTGYRGTQYIVRGVRVLSQVK